VLCHNPDDNLLYCGHVDGWVSVIDASRNLPMGGIEAGDGCGGLCWNPLDRKVYCANPGDSTVTVFDPLGDTVLATVRTERGAGALHYNPVNNAVYCLNNGETQHYRVVGRSVTVIDGTTDEVLGHVPVGSDPASLAWNPVENRTYVACYRGSCVSVIRDSVTGIRQTSNVEVRTTNLPTIVRGSLPLTSSPLPAHYSLLTADGRRVMCLQPGANDIRHLAPGVYFVHSALDNRHSSLVTKVVVTR
jgi:DNA-binding beta-propeller fold protein YncE